MDTSGRAFIDHWDWAVTKGLMNQGTAHSLKSSSLQVISILEDWEQIDVRALDVEDTLNRFKNLKSKNLRPRSLQVYAQRFRQAVASFLEYADDPSTWKPSNRQSSNKARETSSEPRATRKVSPSPKEHSQAPSVHSSGLIEYPYPLRDNMIVHLSLPSDLKIGEVRRLAAFMRTLTTEFDVDDQPEN